MSLLYHYNIAIFSPFILVMLFTTAYSIIDNYNYKSEWLTAGSVISIQMVFTFLYSLIISCLSLTIFLNRFEKIRSNSLWRSLSWLFLPFSFIIIVIVHEINFSMKYEGKLGSDFNYLIILNVPFIIGLIWSYIKYRNSIIVK